MNTNKQKLIYTPAPNQITSKVSRLIALPLFRKELKNKNKNKFDYSIDSVIKLQKEINTRPIMDLLRFNKGTEYFLEYTQNITSFLGRNTNTEENILNFKRFDNDSNNNIFKVPILKTLKTSVDNFIYENKKAHLINNRKKKFNYPSPAS
jgi:hypothetical protein